MRTRPEWIGKNDDQRAPSWVYRRKFEQADGRCEGPCNRKLTAADKWDLDHVTRVRNGGPNRESNLQVLCEWCHDQKTALENRDAGRANAQFARHHGYERRRAVAKIAREGNYKYDWKLRRYVKLLSREQQQESDEES